MRYFFLSSGSISRLPWMFHGQTASRYINTLERPPNVRLKRSVTTARFYPCSNSLSFLCFVEGPNSRGRFSESGIVVQSYESMRRVFLRKHLRVYRRTRQFTLPNSFHRLRSKVDAPCFSPETLAWVQMHPTIHVAEQFPSSAIKSPCAVYFSGNICVFTNAHDMTLTDKILPLDLKKYKKFQRAANCFTKLKPWSFFASLSFLM